MLHRAICHARSGTTTALDVRARDLVKSKQRTNATRPPAGALQAAALAEVLAATGYVHGEHTCGCLIVFATGDDVALAPSMSR